MTDKIKSKNFIAGISKLTLTFSKPTTEDEARQAVRTLEQKINELYWITPSGVTVVPRIHIEIVVKIDDYER